MKYEFFQPPFVGGKIIRENRIRRFVDSLIRSFDFLCHENIIEPLIKLQELVISRNLFVLNTLIEFRQTMLNPNQPLLQIHSH